MSKIELNPTYEDFIEPMPEWREVDLQIDVLTGGITNRLYRVELPDGMA